MIAVEGAVPAIEWAKKVVAEAGLPDCPDGSSAEAVLSGLRSGLDLSMEHALLTRQPGSVVIGVDEAGRGPLCGPVVAAAVMILPIGLTHGMPEADGDAQAASASRKPSATEAPLTASDAAAGKTASPDSVPVPGVTDSKLLSESEREALACSLIRHPRVVWAVAAADAVAIEKHNILRAALDCMTVAADAVAHQMPGTADVHVFVDGNRMPPAFKARIAAAEAATEAEVAKHASHAAVDTRTAAGHARFSAETAVKGDSRCYSIAAASVLAKVMRDRVMVELDHTYPKYGMAGHKGYPTPAHMATVKAIGPSRVHRLTFAPLKGHWERGPDGNPQALKSRGDSE